VLDVKRLRLLVELSRRGTIAAVAQALSYSPSAVSQQLGVLEKEAGTALLEPVGRRVRLTAEGELLVVHAEVVLAELEQAQAGLAASRGEVIGTVRVAAFQSAVLTLMPAVLLRLHDRYPDLRVEVTEMEPERSMPALVSGDFDLVLGEEYPNHPLPKLAGADREPLLLDPLQLVVPASWGWVSLADLAARPFALEPEGTTSREWAAAVCRAEGFEPDVRYTSTDLQIHLRLVQHGLAAALLPGLADASAHSGVAAFVLEGDPARRVFYSTRAGSKRRPALAALIDGLHEAAGSRRFGTTSSGP
jgi:DNA-binding transcriptional LysR family regulator